MSVEVKIGVQNVGREVVLESAQTAEEVTSLVQQALSSGAPLVLQDERGQRVVVPAGAIGYVDIAAETRGRVGFGS